MVGRRASDGTATLSRGRFAQVLLCRTAKTECSARRRPGSGRLPGPGRFARCRFSRSDSPSRLCTAHSEICSKRGRDASHYQNTRSRRSHGRRQRPWRGRRLPSHGKSHRTRHDCRHRLRRRSTDEPLRDRLLLRADGPSTGFIGCAASNAPPHMAPFGGRARFFGTNPFSIGIPAKEEAPLLFDASTSLVARGKIIVAAQEGGRFRLAGQSIRKATQRQTQRRRLPDQCCPSEAQKVGQSL